MPARTPAPARLRARKLANTRPRSHARVPARPRLVRQLACTRVRRPALARGSVRRLVHQLVLRLALWLVVRLAVVDRALHAVIDRSEIASPKQLLTWPSAAAAQQKKKWLKKKQKKMLEVNNTVGNSVGSLRRVTIQ